MFKWLRKTWGERQSGAISDLVWSTNEITPDWKQIQIDRSKDGKLVFSVVGETSATVSTLSKQE